MRSRRSTVAKKPKAKSKAKGCSLPEKYIAIIAEKPKAGDKISYALGRRTKCYFHGIPLWIVQHNSQPLVIVSSAGHLYGPYTNARGYPVFNYEWKPIWIVNKKERHLRRFYEVLKAVLPRAKLYINACDYDIEGSVIGYMIILNLGDIKKSFRMKFSSLAPSEIRRAFSKLQPLDWKMIEAGIARHELDWIWGINVSRALTNTYRAFVKERRILSAGRVQSPTLAEAVRRWREKNLFVPLPSFSLNVILRKGRELIKAKTLGWSPETKEEAHKIGNELRNTGYLTVKDIFKKVREINPPPPFNLGDLQREASRLFGFSPMKTQKIAENLYLEALISYPRTNSQKLPKGIDYRDIIMKIGKTQRYSDLSKLLIRETKGVLRPVQGKKEDPAHPAIYPTGERPKRSLRPDEEKIYDLIIRRFFAVFASKAEIAISKVVFVDQKEREYISEGITVTKEGWMKYYIYARPKEQKIFVLKKREKVEIEKVSVEKNWSRFSIELTKTGLLKWMEKVEIGTEATRARIIEHLFKREYLKGQGNKFYATDLGVTVSEILKNLFPALVTPRLTRIFEEKLVKIRKGVERRQDVVDEAKDTIISLIEEFENRKRDIGIVLAESIGTLKPKTTCIICNKRAEKLEPVPFCRDHLEALLRLKEKIGEISRRLSTSKTESLKAIASRKETGTWVRDVAKLALREPKILKLLSS